MRRNRNLDLIPSRRVRVCSPNPEFGFQITNPREQVANLLPLKRKNKGFTLLEVLLGLTLTALILGIVFASMRLAHRSEEKGRERQEQSQKMRALTDRLTWVLKGAYPYAYQKEEKKVVRFEGEEDKVTFVTTSTDPFSSAIDDTPGLKLVKIFADSDGLKIAEGLFYAKDTDTEYLLDPDVDSVSFEYLDKDEEKDETTWSGQEKNALPAAIKLVISVKGKGEVRKLPELLVPIRAVYIVPPQPGGPKN